MMKEDLTDKQKQNFEPDEMSFQDLVRKTRHLLIILKQNWNAVLFCITISSIGFLINAYLTPKRYPAELTFMVREDYKSGLASVAGLLGQFGFGGTASGEYNLDKVTELMRSRHIIKSAIFDSARINGKSDYLANHIIDIHNYRKEWSDDTLLQNFRFIHGNSDYFSRRENKALMMLHKKMVTDNDAFVSSGYSKQTSILSIKVSAQNEELSIALAESLYRHLSKFYIEQSTAQSRQTVRNLEIRTDSIRGILASSERIFARTEDRSLGLLLQEDRVPQKRLSTDIQILNIMYAETIKNLETASFILKNTTPIFLEIDKPLAPIKPVGTSKKIALAIGILIGLIVASVWILGKSIWQKAHLIQSI